jgi:mRNA-degrading endonuclease YafQ of YafQ-DinJ toxin-antitoxin module
MCRSIGQVLSLITRDHQFESHKLQGHWRLIWSLILGLVRLVEVCVS